MSDLLFKEEVHRVVGCSMEILNTIGCGFHEKIYENALVVEFGLQDIPFEQQREFPIVYKSVKCGAFVPDLICFGSVIVDTKTVDCIGDSEIGQMLNYLRVTGLQLGLLVNFKRSRLEWKRVVANHDP